MSEREIIELRQKLNQGLRESYCKMLQRKMKLGQSVVIADDNGRPKTITAKEAWRRYVAAEK